MSPDEIKEEFNRLVRPQVGEACRQRNFNSPGTTIWAVDYDTITLKRSRFSYWMDITISEFIRDWK